MRYSFVAIALANGAAAQSTSTCVANCGFLGAANYLGQFASNAAQTVPQLVGQFLPQIGDFISKTAPDADATDIPKYILQDTAIYSYVLNLIPSGALDSAEASVASSAGPALWTSIVQSDLGPLFSSFPPDLPATQITSFVSASSAAFYSPLVSVVSTLVPKLQATLSSLDKVAHPTGAATTTSSASAAKTSASTSISKGAAPTAAANGGVIGGAAIVGAIGIAAALL